MLCLTYSTIITSIRELSTPNLKDSKDTDDVLVVVEHKHVVVNRVVEWLTLVVVECTCTLDTVVVRVVVTPDLLQL